MEHALQRAGFVAFFIGLLTLYFLFVGSYAVNVPFWDDWHFVSIFKDVYQGRLNWIEVLLSNSNEHLVGVPFTAMLFLSLVSDHNLLVFVFFSAVFQVCSLLIYIRMQIGFFSSRARGAWVLLATTVFLSLAQVKNTLWAYQFAWYLVTLLFFLSLYFIRRSFRSEVRLEPTSFWLFALASTMAAFSSLQGVFVWVVAGFYLFAKSDFNVKKFLSINGIGRFFVVAGIVFIVFLLVFFLKAIHGGNGRHVELLDFLWLFFGLNGAVSGVFNHKANPFVGIVVLLFSFFAIFKVSLSRDRSSYAIPLSLMLFGLLVTAVISFGRASNGAGVFEEPRYTAYALIFLVGVLEIILREDSTAQISDSFGFVKPAFLVLLCVFSLNSTFSGIVYAIDWRRARSIDLDSMINYRTVSDMRITHWLNWDVEATRNNIVFLDSNRMSFFKVQPVSSSFSALPPSLVRIVESYPGYRSLVNHAWEVYLISGDLQRVFNHMDSDFGAKLIGYMEATSREISDSHPLAIFYKPYKDSYRELLREITS